MAIARFATDLIQQSVLIVRDGSRVPLAAAFRQPAAPLPLVEMPRARGDVSPHQSLLDGSVHREILRLEQAGLLTSQAARAIEWTLATAKRRALDLTGHRFVLLGGTAELSPMSLLLSLGADVLRTHSSTNSLEARVASDLGASKGYAGRLFVARDGVDLLASPLEFTRSIVEFAGGSPVHVGALAYKGGEARELRLTATMDGIVRTLRDEGVLGSVFYYLTSSMVTEVSTETASFAESRLHAKHTAWKQLARAASMDELFRPNIAKRGNTQWTQSVVPGQGASYMGANLFGKIYPAEVLGSDPPATGRPRVSANVAPITKTQSTNTEQTTRLFPNLGTLGVTVFDAADSRRLMGCLMLHDLLHRDRPSGVFTQQVHGGVFTNAWALDGLVKLAYLRARAHYISR
jgi:hypothetical protein